MLQKDKLARIRYFIFQAAVYMGITKNATRYEELLKKSKKIRKQYNAVTKEKIILL